MSLSICGSLSSTGLLLLLFLRPPPPAVWDGRRCDTREGALVRPCASGPVSDRLFVGWFVGLSARTLPVWSDVAWLFTVCLSPCHWDWLSVFCFVFGSFVCRIVCLSECSLSDCRFSVRLSPSLVSACLCVYCLVLLSVRLLIGLSVCFLSYLACLPSFLPSFFLLFFCFILFIFCLFVYTSLCLSFPSVIFLL